jgi:hypothetical protein
MMSRRSPCSKGAATPTCAVQLARAGPPRALPPADSAKEPTLRPEPDEGFVDLPGALEAALTTSAAMRDEQQPSARGAVLRVPPSDSAGRASSEWLACCELRRDC